MKGFQQVYFDKNKITVKLGNKSQTYKLPAGKEDIIWNALYGEVGANKTVGGRRGNVTQLRAKKGAKTHLVSAA
jgi:hypothetical protein